MGHFPPIDFHCSLYIDSHFYSIRYPFIVHPEATRRQELTACMPCPSYSIRLQLHNGKEFTLENKINTLISHLDWISAGDFLSNIILTF